MRRTTKKAVIQLGTFGGVLFLIIYLTQVGPKTRSLAWTTVRYETSSTTLPDARGICPGLEESSKPALIVSRITKDDSNWLNDLVDLYHLCIYTADTPLDTSSTDLQVPANRGHEAMAYLTFLIDNYEHIPTTGAVFVHGSRFAWHNDSPDYDNLALLKALNTSTALQSGYHNLRCDWSASTCPLSTPPQGSLEISMRAIVEPWNARAVSDAAMPRALASIFGGDESAVFAKLSRADTVRAQCCAQFIVSRERVWQHSREEYVALRQWLLDDGAAPSDDKVAGRILSYVWHILFTEPVDSGGIDLEQLNERACPRAEDCYCRLYGRCDLQDCSAGRCAGQYDLPKGFTLPDDWAATHS